MHVDCWARERLGGCFSAFAVLAFRVFMDDPFHSCLVKAVHCFLHCSPFASIAGLGLFGTNQLQIVD